MKALLKNNFNSECIKIWVEFITFISPILRGESQYKQLQEENVGGDNGSEIFYKLSWTDWSPENL